MVARGAPGPMVEFALGQFLAARRGEFAATDPALEELLGRPAISLRTVLGQVVAQAA